MNIKLQYYEKSILLSTMNFGLYYFDKALGYTAAHLERTNMYMIKTYTYLYTLLRQVIIINYQVIQCLLRKLFPLHYAATTQVDEFFFKNKSFDVLFLF